MADQDSTQVQPNACVARYGPGPEDAPCGSCANLLATAGPAHAIYTCAIDGTPRRVSSPSCAFFMEAPLLQQVLRDTSLLVAAPADISRRDASVEARSDAPASSYAPRPDPHGTPVCEADRPLGARPYVHPHGGRLVRRLSERSAGP